VAAFSDKLCVVIAPHPAWVKPPQDTRHIIIIKVVVFHIMLLQLKFWPEFPFSLTSKALGSHCGDF